MNPQALLLLSFVLSCSSLSGQQVWHVNQFAGGANDGSNWPDAFTDLQAALAVAGQGDQIWVAKGTYLPTATDDRAISFNLPQGVKMYGGFSGTETALSQRAPSLHTTVLSGDIGLQGVNTDNSYHVVTIYQGDGETAIDGFTITLGYGNEAFSGFPHEFGGGLLVTADTWWPLADPVISNCTFVSNRAGMGGGLALVSDEYTVCSPTVTSCRFVRNQGGFHGGGLYKEGGSTVKHTFRLSNCDFEENRSRYGAGVYLKEMLDSLLLKRCVFLRDTAINQGGAVYATFAAGSVYTRFDSCNFHVNRCGMSQDGGAVCFAHHSPPIPNIEKVEHIFNRCDFWFNKAESGGAISIGNLSNAFDYQVVVTLCKFRNSVVSGRGSAIELRFNGSATSRLYIDRSHFFNNVSTSRQLPAISVRNHSGGPVYNQTLVSNSTFMYNDGIISSEMLPNSTADVRVVNCSSFRNGKRPFYKRWHATAENTRTHVLNSIIWEPQVEGIHHLFYNEFGSGGMGSSSPFAGYTVEYCLLEQANCAYNGEEPCGPGMMHGVWPGFVDTFGGIGLPVWGATIPVENRGNTLVADTFGLVTDFIGIKRVMCDTVDLGAYEVYCPPSTAIHSPFSGLPFIAELLQNPVPAGQALAVECLPSATGTVRAQLWDLGGRLILSLPFQTTAQHRSLLYVPTEGLSPGVYYLKLTDERGNGRALKAVVK